MKIYISLFLILLPALLYASGDSTKSRLIFSGYLDIYYAYDFGNPANHLRPSFTYNHNRHNEVNLNLGYAKAAYNDKGVRANLALMAGTYAQYNLASEQGLLKNIFEANAGINLSKKRQFWLDAGIFSSHIGFESAISKDCWTLTRSIAAENSPYYESGVKLSYTTLNGKWLFSGMELNGWQRIRRVTGNNTPAFGTQVVFKPSPKITLNSSTFIGNDKPDNKMRMRYFHNYYGIFQITPRWGVITGFDIGAEQVKKGSAQYNIWYTPTLISRYKLAEKFMIAARSEYYYDPHNVIIIISKGKGFQTFGYSANLDYSPMENIVLRLEGKVYSSKTEIFKKGNSSVSQNYCITSSIAVKF